MKQFDIVFYHHGKAILPGIYSYVSYFSSLGINCAVEHKSNGNVPYGLIHWKHMGIDTEPISSGKIKVHEYTSTSVPPFSRIKDYIKKIRNCKPKIRIFQNSYIKNVYSFNDGIEYFYRPVTCGEHFFNDDLKSVKKSYDFVYSGTLDPTRKIEKPLLMLINKFPNRSFQIIGQPTGKLYRELSNHSNVIIKGKVPYQDVPYLIASARFGLNLVPDIYPFNKLMSTKLLEYSAIGLPILTLGGVWVESFEREKKARFFYINRDNLDDLENYCFITPQVNEYHPAVTIGCSGITKWVKDTLNKV